MIERRAATGELRLLGGMARGRPALATVLMIVGVISLAVPLSTSFAGEFLILAGVFQQGWAWAVVGAVAIVLAAMYMLRVISAVLHQDVGSAVPEAALDLRLGELGVVVPLVLCLIGLSAWPNLVSGHAFGGGKAQDQVNSGLRLTAHRLAGGTGFFPENVSCTGSCHAFLILSGNVVYTGVAPGAAGPGGHWTRYTP
jgi:formate hydrogenlyase subunit 3/multisubunit Na+/H+ antiporter MnhD subunit